MESLEAGPSESNSAPYSRAAGDRASAQTTPYAVGSPLRIASMNSSQPRLAGGGRKSDDVGALLLLSELSLRAPWPAPGATRA